jgi:hypothetical protein
MFTLQTYAKKFKNTDLKKVASTTYTCRICVLCCY